MTENQAKGLLRILWFIAMILFYKVMNEMPEKTYRLMNATKMKTEEEISHLVD